MNTKPNTPASRNEAVADLLPSSEGAVFQRQDDLEGKRWLDIDEREFNRVGTAWRRIVYLAAPGAAGAMDNPQLRECGNDECGWKGATDRMLGSIGPLCPHCGETTEATPSEALSPATVAQPVEDERRRLRVAQSDAVMPQIGPLLDAWEGVNNDTKGLIRAHAPGLARHIASINRAMEDCVPAAQTCASQGCATGKTMYALKWTAAALQAVIESRGESGSINMIVSGEKKSLGEVLDLADAALSTAKSVEHGATDGGTGE